MKAVLLVAIALLAACSARRQGGDREQAIADAKSYMLRSASEMKNHRAIKASDIRVEAVEQNDDGGWDITLQAKSCEYAIYSKPGVEIESEGVNAECFTKIDFSVPPLSSS
jgi:hypothetical protein